MEGIEKNFADVCITAVMSARRALMNMPAAQALTKTKYGKGDTLGLDGGPEIAITEAIHRYKGDALLVTEETDEETRGDKRWPENSHLPVVFVSDPTDRSKYLRAFLEAVAGSAHMEKKVGDLLSGSDRESKWNDLFSAKHRESPLSIVGPTSAITCVRRGRPFFSAIVNYLTDQIFIAGPTGVFSMNLPDYRKKEEVEAVDFDFVIGYGQRLCFPSAKQACPTNDDHLRFVTYLGKAGYQENFDATAIFLGQNPKAFLHHSEPGGPSRVLYLSDLQKEHGSIGFVMSNGEKIGEFIHWLPFVIHATTQDGQKALHLYEVSIERPWTKENVLMSTCQPYSIFQRIEGEASHYLNVRQLRRFEHPSHFRSTIIVTQADNSPVKEIMGTHCYREISLT